MRKAQHILSNVFVWTKAPAAKSDSDTEVAEDGSETEVEEEEDEKDKGQGEGSDEEEEEDEERIPKFTEEVLMAKKVDELREICHKYKVRSGGRKKIIVDNILSRVAIVHQQFSAIQETEHLLSSTKFSGSAILHDSYLHHFNWVDLANRLWQRTEEHHQHHFWSFKYLLLLLRFGTINAHIFFLRQRGANILEFRGRLAAQLKSL